jgi:hypothetical protein
MKYSFGVVLFGFVCAGLAQAQVPDAHPRAPRVEFGGGYETAIDENSENLLIEVSLRPRFPGTWGGRPETRFYRTRIEFSGAIDVSGPGIVSPQAGEMPYMRLTFVPVEIAEGDALSPTTLYEHSLGFAPVNVSRDLRMGRDSTLRVNIASVRGAYRVMFNREFGMIANFLVDAIGYKLINALSGSPERDMHAFNFGTISAGFGGIFRPGNIVSFTLYLGLTNDFNLGQISGTGLGYQQDTMGYVQLQSEIAGYALVFLRMSVTQATYGSESGLTTTPGILQFMAGARVTF